MFHVGFLSQEYEVDEWIHGNSLAHPRTTHSMYHIAVHIHTDSVAVAPSSHEQPTVAFSDTSYRGASSPQNVPDPVCDPQQPIPPKPVYGYITSTGRCLHKARCKHLRGFHKPLTLCDCIHQSKPLQLFADTDDRVHVSSCDLKSSTTRCLTWCKDCW